MGVLITTTPTPEGTGVTPGFWWLQGGPPWSLQVVCSDTLEPGHTWGTRVGHAVSRTWSPSSWGEQSL